jgi:hypothetical protein
MASSGGPTATHYDFASSLVAARTLPTAPDGVPGTIAEFPPTFPPETLKEEQAPLPSMNAGDIATDLAVRQFSEVFLLWRPWEKCKRCLQAIDKDEIVLPEDSDYTCPHTHKAKYKEKVDFCLKGNGAMTLREYFNMANGNRLVHLEWVETDPEAAERLRRKAETAKQNSLAPTFGTGDLNMKPPNG